MHPENIFKEVVDSYPQPLAIACQDYIDADKVDAWTEWAILSRDVLTATLHYLSHVVLAELAASEAKVPQLLYWIEKVLKRPLTGQYLGFIRETTRYFYEHEVSSDIPELFDFLRRAELEKSLTGDGRGLIEVLVAYRNQWAHGKVSSDAVAERSVAEVRRLTALLLKELGFLKRYPLENEAGDSLMGVNVAKGAGVEEASTISLRGSVSLRPLMLKVRQGQIALLEQVDFNRLRMAYRSSSGSHKFTRKDVEKKEAFRVLEELRRIYDKVRSLQGQLERLDYGQFCERAALVTDGTLEDYKQIGKYDREIYVPRSEWAGEDGLLARFLRSDKTLLALDGAQGSGKSAQLASIADQCRKENYPVLFVNAQRFSFFEVAYRSENPFPFHFASLLNVARVVDSASMLTDRKRKGAKPTVIIIDGINEIDGWDGKWNRFRAMEELLTWVVQVADPRLKIMCGFRLEAYQEYGYLKPDDLPPGLDAVAWTPEVGKPWTVRLAPFALTDARLLFERLLERPEDGMSPKFTWDEMVSAMGDSLNAFSANPLLFRIFLRAHHGRDAVLSQEPEAVFRSYIDQLTGREAARKRTWWLKLISFFRNGGVTTRERLLADVVKVASAAGGMGFHVEDLNEKRDRRLLRALEDPKESGFEVLCDAQVLSEEQFQLRDAVGEEQGKRRVSYVAEALETVLRQVQERTDRLHSFFSMFGMIALASVVIVIAILCMGALFRMAYAEKVAEAVSSSFRASDQLDYVALYERTLGAYVYACLQMSAAVLGTLLCFLVFLESFKRYAYLRRAVLALSVHHRIWGKFLSVLFRPITAGILPLLAAFLIYALLVPSGQGPEWVHRLDHQVAAIFHFDLFAVLLVVLCSYLAGVLLTVYRPGVLPNCMMFQHVCLDYPRRLVRYTLNDYLQVFGPEESRRQRRIKWLPTLKTLAVTYILIVIVYVFTLFFESEGTDVIAAQDSNWFRILKLEQQSSYVVSNTWRMVIPVILALPLFSAALLFSMPSVRSLMSRVKEKLSHVRYIPMYRMQLLAVGYYYAAAFVGLFCFLAFGFLFSQRAERSAIEERTAIIEMRDRLSDQELFTNGYVLDLSDSMETVPVETITALAHLTELYLPTNFSETVDVSLFDDLQVLSGPAKAFAGWGELEPLYRKDSSGKDGNRLRKLSLWDPGSLLGSGFEAVLSTDRLEIHGQCDTLDALGRAFPALVTLSIDERHGELVNASAIGNRKNLVIEVRGGSVPELEWLSSVSGQCIIRLMAPIGPESRNLGYLERLFMPSDGLDPQVLSNCNALRWLHLEVPEAPTEEWLQALSKVIDNNLPLLETLEFSKELAVGPMGRTPEFGRYKPYYLANGRDNIMELIDYMLSERNRLFEGD